MNLDDTLPLDQLPDPLPIEPLTRPFDVTITPPGSKSITCRAYVLAALAKGESRIVRPLRADDTDRLLDALCTLGAEASWVPGETGDGSEDVLITGVSGRFPRGGEVNLGDGGTPTRFMIACACLASEPVVVDGSKRMRERPIAEGVDMLRELGAKIVYVDETGSLPVRVVPSEHFKGGELNVGRTQSSQFISALMLVGPWLERGVILRLPPNPTSASYIQMTHDLLDEWTGGSISRKRNGRNSLNASFAPRATPSEIVRIEHVALEAHESFRIDIDASSTVYWIAAALLTRGSKYHVAGLGGALWQPDLGAIETMMKRTGYPDSNTGERLMGGPSRFDGFNCDARDWPDGSLVIGVCAAVADGPSTLTGLHTLRVKETDRIAALANELRKIGCEVETTDDSITIHPMPRALLTPLAQGKEAKRIANPRARSAMQSGETEGPLSDSRGSSVSSHRQNPRAAEPVVIETYNDHRMAMAFGILGLVRPGVSIRTPACVAKSYPAFWRDFAKLYER